MHFPGGFLVIAGFISSTLATVLHSQYHLENNLISRESSTTTNNTSIRILPIGDSITWGYGSTDGNGYRLHLRNLLAGNSVTYLGHILSGNMTNSNNEGYSGKLIAEIRQNVQTNGSLAQGPNLVLILAGTNDINLNINAGSAPSRLGSLIDLVTNACPDAAVIVSYITPIWGEEEQERVETYNAAIPAIVEMRNSSTASGNHVIALNMTRFVTTDDLGDGLHPTDHGYLLMARGWASAIKQVAEKGWLNVNNTEGPTATLTTPVAGSTPTTKPENSAVSMGGFGGLGLLVAGFWILVSL